VLWIAFAAALNAAIWRLNRPSHLQRAGTY
jgi:tryptophan-rich sensory protein